MAEKKNRTGIGNILIYILIGLILLAILLYFLLPFEISIAIIVSSFLAFIVFAATLVFYRWVLLKRAKNAAKYIIFSFIAKIIFLGAMFYLIIWLDLVNIIAFAISFIVFFTVFLYIEVFMIYKRLLLK